MSNESYNALGKEQIIKSFLQQVEKKLPGWLKDDRKEKAEVLGELEDHIWDKAQSFAGENEPTAYDIQRAVDSMGDPSSIAREYKKRGTPKIWITEEFWPWYLKGLRITLMVIISLNLIGLTISMVQDPSVQAIVDFVSGVFSGFFGAAILITILFVVFSMEGFLPEDFKEMAEKEHEKEEKKKIKKNKKPKPPLKREDLVSEGIMGIIWGFLLITMPIQSINNYLGPEMVDWLSIAGIFACLGGIVSIMQALIGIDMINGQRFLILVNKILDIIFFPRMLIFWEVIRTVPSLANLEPGVQATLFRVFDFMPYLVIFGLVVGIIEALVKMATLRSKYEAYLKRIENYEKYN